MMRPFVFAVVLFVSLGTASREAAADVAEQAREVLKERCTSCHGKVNPQNGLNVLDHDALLVNAYVTPARLDESSLWERVSTPDDDAVMPPGERLSEAELAVLRQWIEAGAPAVSDPTADRPRVTMADVMAAVAADLRTFPSDDRPRLRYFSIAHLHNNPTVSDADLRVYRAALSKLVNSLSWQPTLLIPQPVDAHATVLRVDLVRLGWDRGRLWQRILTEYPYGLTYEESSDPDLRAEAAFVYEATGTRLPILRGDWFVARAASPPLYHDLLELPSGAGADRKLEELLRVDVRRDFEQNLLARGAFIKSNVSQHNRLVDRHDAAFGAYWKSYDFGSSSGRGSLTQFPLGPEFDGNPHNRVAFRHDGGELIFHLPNGLQGYLLVDGRGARIDKGPILVVADSKMPLNNREVINGISCMVCHAHGMQPFQDDIRQGHGVRGSDAVKVERLFRPQTEMDQLVQADRDRFLAALEKAIGPFVRQGPDADLPLTEFREPVGAIAKQFSDDLSFEDVVAELGHSRGDELKVLFRDPGYRQFGLGVIVDGKSLKRDTWEKMEPFSIYHEVADRLELGTPERVFP
jgi:serine/threonine-protein kinase